MKYDYLAPAGSPKIIVSLTSFTAGPGQGVAAVPAAIKAEPLLDSLGKTRGSFPADNQNPSHFTLVDWITEIKKAWMKCPASTLGLAQVMCAAREQLAHGEWSRLWKSGCLPFCKRKGDMLVAIGSGLSWANEQTFARLPIGWSILYQLAKLDRSTVERCIHEGVIHPALKLSEARRLVAQFRGKKVQNKSRRASLRKCLRRFEDFLDDNLPHCSDAERDLVRATLTGFIEQIAAADRADFQRDGAWQILEMAP